MDANDCSETANGGGISSAGRTNVAHTIDPAAANDANSTTTTTMSTGGLKKPSKSRKFNKLFQFPSVLKKLNDYNLFPHKIKAISDDSNVHNRKSSADAPHRDNLSREMDSSSNKPVDSRLSESASERNAKRNSIRKSISNSLRNSMRSAKKSSPAKGSMKSSIVKCSPKAANSPGSESTSEAAASPSNPSDHRRSDNDCSPNSSANSFDNSFDNSFHESPDQSSSSATDRSPLGYPSDYPSYRKSPLLRLLAVLQPSHASHSTPLNRLIFLSAILFILLLSFLTDLVYCDHINLPPRFVTLPGYSSDIVLTIKEGNSSLNKEIYRLAGEDPNDGDRLRFGVMGPIGNDILRIENDVPTLNQATIYLKKELDRETQPSYSLVLTLTDGKLAKGSYVSKKSFFFFLVPKGASVYLLDSIRFIPILLGFY